jgi:hypothetical protein
MNSCTKAFGRQGRIGVGAGLGGGWDEKPQARGRVLCVLCSVRRTARVPGATGE